MSFAADASAASAVGAVLLSGFAFASRLPPARSTTQPIDRRRPHLISRRALTIFAATIGATLAIAFVGLLPTVGLGGVLWVHQRVVTLLQRRRARVRLAIELPDAIEMLVLTVRAGLSPHQAIRDLTRGGPPSLRPAFVAVVHELDRGNPLAEAIGVLRRQIGMAADPLVDALAAAERYGSPLAPVLDRLAFEARAARRRHDEARARRLPVRLSFPLVLCTLPAFALLAVAPPVLAALSSLGMSAL